MRCEEAEWKVFTSLSPSSSCEDDPDHERCDRFLLPRVLRLHLRLHLPPPLPLLFLELHEVVHEDPPQSLSRSRRLLPLPLPHLPLLSLRLLHHGPTKCAPKDLVNTQLIRYQQSHKPGEHECDGAGERWRRLHHCR